MSRISVLVLIFVFAAFTACGSKQTKEPSVGSMDWGAWVKASNKQLEKVPVKGFAYKSSKVPAQNWDKWAKTAAPVVKGIIDKLPKGYVLQVTGHTDARGPEEPEGNKPGNIRISQDRANSVRAALKRQGISSPKLTAKGVGSAQPRDGADEKSPAQRRVSFIIVPE